jgi:hypothetical protein
LGWPKGKPRHPNAGRKKGTPNKATREVKEFLADLCQDPEVQAAVRERILNGEAALFFRAVEQVFGKPHQSMDLSVKERKMIDWPAEVATEADVNGEA